MPQGDRTIFGRPLSPGVAACMVRLGAAWIGLGGVLKLFWGSPYDLPEILRSLTDQAPVEFFALVIGIELFIAVLAMVSPRLGWWAVAGLLAAFTIIAGIETMRGAEACGCFGGAVAIPPWLVTLLDLVLLAALLAVQPWSMLRSGAWRFWAVGPALGGFVAAMLVIGEESSYTSPDLDNQNARNTIASPTPPRNPPAGNGGPSNGSASSPIGGATSHENETPPLNQGLPPDPPAESIWRLPDQMPRFVVLQPNRWVGQALAATNLATWADVSRFPADATLIFFMDTCPHCAELLRQRAMLLSPPDYVLIRVPAPPNLPIYVKNEIPSGMRIDLPRGTRWNIEVPWEVVVQGGIVQSAEFHRH